PPPTRAQSLLDSSPQHRSMAALQAPSVLHDVACSLLTFNFSRDLRTHETGIRARSALSVPTLSADLKLKLVQPSRKQAVSDDVFRTRIAPSGPPCAVLRASAYSECC